MNLLRRLPTRQLLALIAGVVLALACVSAVAVAALGGSGPVPGQEPLANAVHDALAAPAPAGISARITFANHLLDSAGLDGQGPSNPLLAGASGRLWASADGHVRIELQGDNGDTEIMLAPGSARIYETESSTLYTLTLPQPKPHATGGATEQIPAVQTIQSFLDKLAGHADVSGAIPTDVAGQPAYAVTIAPKDNTSLLDSLQLIWDAGNGVPLRVSVFAKGDTTAVIELTVNHISFGTPSPGDLSVTPAPGVKVVNLDAQRPKAAATPASGHRHPRITRFTGTLPFTLAAPATAGGLAVGATREIQVGDTPAAIVTYGKGLGSVVVVERQSKQGGGSSSSSSGLGSLPSVTLHTSGGAVSATELVTPLGTFLAFDSGGVSYVVAGSVPQATAEAVAAAL